jgi:hypothetical protein
MLCRTLDHESVSDNLLCVVVAWALMREGLRKVSEKVAGATDGYRRIDDMKRRVTGGFRLRLPHRHKHYRGHASVTVYGAFAYITSSRT